MRKIKAWAVTANKKLIAQENNHLHPLLVFETKRAAVEAMWGTDEIVRRVSITIEKD